MLVRSTLLAITSAGKNGTSNSNKMASGASLTSNLVSLLECINKMVVTLSTNRLTVPVGKNTELKKLSSLKLMMRLKILKKIKKLMMMLTPKLKKMNCFTKTFCHCASMMMALLPLKSFPSTDIGNLATVTISTPGMPTKLEQQLLARLEIMVTNLKGLPFTFSRRNAKAQLLFTDTGRQVVVITSTQPTLMKLEPQLPKLLVTMDTLMKEFLVMLFLKMMFMFFLSTDIGNLQLLTTSIP
mmetsp:Transcript_20344/g.17630  ORF Transcript_20344/g.17630 Transcript_20344/m.17630 type:complete len:241 (+) Transcript_20344:1501-2223(+)